MSAEAEPGMVPMSTAVPISVPVDVSLPIPFSKLRGKTILITGGSSGFGAACARLWASHGANVIIGDVADTPGEELIASLRTTTDNPNHHYLHCDVTSWPSQSRFFAAAARLSPHGGIDVVMANAGVSNGPENMRFEDPPDYPAMAAAASLSENSDDAAAPRPPRLRTIDVNLTGVLYTTHLALAYLRANPGSKPCSSTPPAEDTPRDRCLLLVSSIAGVMPLASMPLYAVSKHGVVGLFRTLRSTGSVTTGVRVNMINPYFVDTPILGSMGALMLAGGAMASIDDVVSAATRLVADSTIIGRALVVGARSTAQQAHLAGLGSDFKAPGQAVWDMFADDFGQTDLFTRRIVAITNMVTTARGWGGVVADVWGMLTGTAKK